MLSRLLKLVAVVAISLVVFLPTSFAQKTTGDISGTVTDPSGAAVPGSTVTLTDQATGATRKATSNGQGGFSFPQVEVGTYTITATKEGFKTITQKDVAVHVSTVTTVPVQLQVGATTEVITVEASALNLNTENGEVGNVMLSNQVSQLPLNGRNFIQLTTLMPGAAVGEGFDNKSKGLLAGVHISFSGAPASTNQWSVNGANNNDEGSQTTILVYPSVDAIQEFKISRNSYGPEYGGAGGAQINLITKSGGNQFHGSAYYYGRNDKLNAENFFLGQQKANCVAGDPVCGKKNFLRRNDYGYTVGGPIKKDKLFFFWSEEWNKERRGQVRQAWIPTAAERGSIANGVSANWNDIANCPAGSGAPAVPNDPTTGSPFPNNTIPVNQLSPAGEAYLSQVPLPNLTNLCGQNNWVSQVAIPLDWREENVRGDYNINSSTTLMINFTNDSWLNPTHAYEEGGLWGDQNWPAVSDTWSQPSHMLVAKLTSTIGGNKINEFSFAWSANRINITQSGDNPQLQQQIVSAMPLIFPQSGKTHAKQLPEQICWCSSYIGTIGPWNNRQDLYTWKDDFSWVKGSHTLKLGVLYDRNGKDEETGEEAGGLWGGAGYLIPGNYAASLQGPGFSWSSPTGNMWSDAILKNTLWGANENSSNPISLARWRDTEFYFGDTWKMTKKLTVDYGFRYSLMPNAFQEGNRLASFEPYAYSAALGTSPCNGIVLAKGAPNGCAAQGFPGGVYSKWNNLVPENKHLIAPRLGAAWDVLGKARWVLRAGVGQFFARDPISPQGTSLLGANPPFTVGVAPERTLDGPTFSPCNGDPCADPNANMLDFAVGGTPSLGLEQNTNLTNTWQWNLTNEVAPFHNAKLEVAYVGLRGIHLNEVENIVEIAPQNRLAWLLRPPGTNDNQLFPFGALFANAPGRISYWAHRGDSIYHSLQSMFTLKMTRNSIWQTSYTWSKNIGNTEADYTNNSNGGIADIYNPRASRGLLDFDRPHVFASSLVYNLPTLEGHSSFLKQAVGGWETSTIVSLASGPALTITGALQGVCLSACGTSNEVDVGSDPWGLGATQYYGTRPLMTGKSCFSGDKLHWLNTAAFTMNGYVLGSPPPGDIGQCHGPGIQDVDFSIDKNWTLHENIKLQFRLETFNLFNHPMFRFGTPGSDVNVTFTGNGGQIVNNVVQGTTLLPGSGFGDTPFSSNLGNREIQYALKLIF